MNESQIINIAERAMYTTALLGIPILAVCLVIGLIVTIFETATQIHEQALTFVPKIIAVALLLVISGGWMISQLESFTREAFNQLTKLS